jgi:hypothetical protein
MPYLRNFEHDVFVSYGHGPKTLGYNGDGNDFVREWTQAFVDSLTAHVALILGTKDPERRVRIWMDPALEGNQPLGENLKSKVQRSALLLVVMSPFYLQSGWCGRELDWFAEKAGNEGARVFVIRAFGTDETKWPARLTPGGSALPGYPFQSSDDPSFPLGWPQPDKTEQRYWDQMVRLAHQVASQLKVLEYVENEVVEPAASAIPERVGRSVFLGYMHDSLQDLRADLRARLNKSGLTVLPPENDDPVDETTLRASFEKYVPQSSALVLVANENCELWPKGQVGGAVNLQLQLARECKRAVHLRLKVGDSAGIRNASYREFLTGLTAKAQHEPGLAIAWKDIDEFVDYIGNKLDNVRTNEPGAEQFAVAVVCSNVRPGHALHEDFNKLVISSIRDTERGAIVADREDSGQIRLTTLQQDLARADSLVVVCFDQDWEWANKIILQLKQLVGGCRDKIKLVVTGPEHKSKGEYYGPFKFTTVLGVGPDNVVSEQAVRSRIISALQGS